MLQNLILKSKKIMKAHVLHKDSMFINIIFQYFWIKLIIHKIHHSISDSLLSIHIKTCRAEGHKSYSNCITVKPLCSQSLNNFIIKFLVFLCSFSNTYCINLIWKVNYRFPISWPAKFIFFYILEICRAKLYNINALFLGNICYYKYYL